MSLGRRNLKTYKEIRSYMHDELQKGGYYIDVVNNLHNEISNPQSRKWSGYTWGIKNNQWFGFIPHHGMFEGAMISILDDIPWVIRDYPAPNDNISIAQDTRIHPKLDGVEIRLMVDPNGDLWGRSREIEYIRRNSRYNQDLFYLFQSTDYAQGIEDLCKQERVTVIGSLMSKYIPSGYRQWEYQKDNLFFIYDIIDAQDNFLNNQEMEILTKRYSLENYTQNIGVDDNQDNRKIWRHIYQKL